MASLPDFSADTGLSTLEKYLSTRSYIDGHSPSQADVAVFDKCKAPDAEKYPHVARWFQHIASYEAEHPNLTGDKARAAALLAPAQGSTITTPAAAAAATADDDDDDVDLFGSDEEEDAEAERIKAERVAEYNRKRAEKEKVKGKTIAKSVVTLQVKPWDDETDLDAMEKEVRAIEKDGLVWGASKKVPVGYGVYMIQFTLVVEDDKVSIDELQEQIQEIEDYVQSSDVAAMQKL
ncbi:hypothetical protein FA10DRAFT_264632 [Acaromyces ingoldii]|uniref:Elongation factor 1-beta n=1 Tax=Acaromyces ingoldii TaxID=215250 RepID=A0A316YWY0_9BASI|nr:hypothetical protein FA10DRAFT_264632 [Acaromyces ingoldii]PWN94040.1 hypothetical protein FA10DRAFT_264632 [Acaromyces ingoldii]